MISGFKQTASAYSLSNGIRTGALAVLGFLAITALLWIPFGLQKVGLLEDWAFYQRFGAMHWLYLGDNTQPNRPLIGLSWAIGYLLTPSSFVGLNTLHLLLMLLRASALFSLLRMLLPGKTAFAFLTALLFIVYPADTGMFSLRTSNYHLTLTLFLVAVTLLVGYWKRPHPLTLVAALAAVAVCLGNGEGIYGLVFLCPALLLWLERQLTRRLIIVTLLWWLLPALHVLWTLSVLSMESSYQARLLLQSDSSGFAGTLDSYLTTIARAYTRSFVEGWTDIVRALQPGSYFLPIALLGGALTAAVGMVLAKFSARPRPTDRRLYVVLVLVGLVVLGCGFAPFLLSPARVENERVFTYAQIGAALAVTALCFWVGTWLPRGKTFVVGVLSILIGIAIVGGLHQHWQRSIESLKQQQLLASMAQQMPAIRQDALVLILDPELDLTPHHALFAVDAMDMYLADALKYVYGDASLKMVLCYPESPESDAAAATMDIYRSHCQPDADGVARVVRDERDVFPCERIAAFQYDQGQMRLLDRLPDAYYAANPGCAYDPAPLVQQGTLLPVNAPTLFEHWPFVFPPMHQAPQPIVNIEFDQPLLFGSGWYVPEGSVTWMVDTTAVIDVLLPPDGDYLLQFHVLFAIAPDVLESLQVRVNDTPLSLTYIIAPDGAPVYSATIPQAVVARDPANTRLAFTVNRTVSPLEQGQSSDPRSLALLFDWLRIEPTAAAP